MDFGKPNNQHSQNGKLEKGSGECSSPVAIERTFNNKYLESNGNNIYIKKRSTLETERTSTPNNQAMLQALRVVLDLPLKPIVLTENENE
jgi:hypothetical protein